MCPNHQRTRVALGGTYSLLALGLAVVYNMLGFVHFAYGEQLALSAYALYLAESARVPIALAPLACLAGGVVAAVGMGPSCRTRRSRSPRRASADGFATDAKWSSRWS
jgi:branched-subunit amino acid ABC-type transport system permease component